MVSASAHCQWLAVLLAAGATTRRKTSIGCTVSGETVNSPRDVYSPHLDATPNAEASTLGSVYRFILDCHANRNAASVPSTDGDDAMKGSEHDRAIPNYTG
jgi:hypothetical protein